MDVFVFNDHSSLNKTYRKKIVDLIREEGFTVHSVGWMDGLLGIWGILKLYFYPKKIAIISSNLRSNILTLLFFPLSKGIVILNGMGRKRRSPIFRKVLLLLIQLNGGKIFCIQNYADYRFLALCKSRSSRFRARLEWVQGSGGNTKDIGTNLNTITMVQRDSKISLTWQSVLSFISQNIDFLKASDIRISVVGLDEGIIPSELSGIKIENVGRVSQNDILKFGGSFLHPGGYGEGLPHSLVDAICSNLNIYIHKNDYIGFGFYRLFKIEYNELNGSWIKIRSGDFSHEILSEPHIVDRYKQLFLESIKYNLKSKKY